MSVGAMLGYAIVVTLVVIFWILLVLFIIRNNRKKAAAQAARGIPADHMSHYFEEYFPSMIKSFDLVTKTRFDEWASAMKTRLARTGETIDNLRTHRKTIDQRVGKLEGRLEKLEKA
jgi:BMFP domain-containing protein YqiC